MPHKIAQIVFALPVDGPFDYAVPLASQESLKEGSRVFVPFGRQKKVGFVTGLKDKSRVKGLKPIIKVLDPGPVLSKEHLAFAREFAQMYGCTYGEAMELLLPASLRGRTPFPYPLASPYQGKVSVQPSCLYLGSDTGQVWDPLFKDIRNALDEKRGVMILAPEGSAVEKVLETLKSRLDIPPILYNRTLAVKDELTQWTDIKTGKSPLVVGTRSVVFAPFENLGLIIIFHEEHSSYKQEQSPFYHVREVVEILKKIHHAKLIYVSSAPTAELFYDVKKKKIEMIRLQDSQYAGMQMVDLSNYKPQYGSAVSYPLQNEIQKVLDRGKKAILILNRRGFSSRTHCNTCGFVMHCERCSSSLIYLSSQKRLVCPLCDFTSHLPQFCPRCKGAYMRSTGTGIEKLETHLARWYPKAVVFNYDRDTKRIPENANLIVATQAIIKELKNLKADLVGILDIDREINRMDFRGAQKAFSLLMNLRTCVTDKVLVQTYERDNYCLKSAMMMDADNFYKKELSIRKELNLPPFTNLVAICLRGKNEETVLSEMRRLFALLQTQEFGKAEIFDPQPDVHSKLRDQYRFTTTLKSKNVKPLLVSLHGVLKSFKKKSGIILTVNVNP